MRIAIIGAGPAGATLGRLLHLANIDCTIFEAEKSLDHRSQGGTLDLHHDSGLAALKECQLFDRFLEFCRYDGEAFVVADKHYRTYIKQAGKTTETRWGRPEIDRVKLRMILLESLPEGMVQWGRRLRQILEVDGKFIMQFDVGEEKDYDLVVGADGAWSKVRPLLSEVMPHYSGISGIWGSVTDAAITAPEVYKAVGRGSLFSFSDYKGISGQQLGDGSINASVVMVQPESWIQQGGISLSDGKSLKALALGQIRDWDPRLKAIFEAVDPETIQVRKLFMLPIGHHWRNRPGVTLIGDAAHLMTPFAGEGVNLAMSDAKSLAQHLITAHNRSSVKSTSTPAQILAEELRSFEEDMFQRATKFQQMTYDMMNYSMMTEGTPFTTIGEYAYTATKDMVPHGLQWLARFLLIFLFWVKKKFFLSVEK